MAEEKRETKNFTLDELVAIGDHIHKCDTAIIITDTLLNDKDHEVLCTLAGSPENLIGLMVNNMKNIPAFADFIRDCFSAYQFSKIENKKNNNNNN